MRGRGVCAHAIRNEANTIMTTENDLSDGHADDRESRFNRGLRVVFVLLILLSIVSGYATRPTIHTPMRRVLRDAQIVEVVRQSPSWERPFLEWVKRPLLVRHRSPLVMGQGAVAVESVFTAGGFYLGSRSVISPERHERRATDDLELALTQNHERYEPVEEISRDFSLPVFWERMAQEVDLRGMTSFRLFPARFVSDTRFAESPVPVMVLHIWCETPEDDDFEEAEGAPAPCPQMRRYVIDLASDQVLRNDYLL